jgi:hypothetical protein
MSGHRSHHRDPHQGKPLSHRRQIAPITQIGEQRLASPDCAFFGKQGAGATPLVLPQVPSDQPSKK